MTDEQCLQHVAAGDAAAFSELVDRHADRLYRLAVSLVGNRSDAEDVLQESLAGAFRGAGNFRGTGSAKSWLNGIVVTQAAKFWRDRGGRKQMRLVDESIAAAGTESGVGARLDLHAALAKLSVEHREILVLREMQGMDYREIAELLTIPRGTVESRLHRARGELRKLLEVYRVES